MKKMAPILILCYQRVGNIKEITKKVLSLTSNSVYIFIDGPKNDADKVNNIKLKEFLENLSSEHSNIKLNPSSENLGLKRATISAINWTFEKEEECIFIEDDIIPSDSFFKFTTAMLDKYKSDKNVYSISGCNLNFIYQNNPSYFFTRTFIPWGFATWKNRWERIEMNTSVYESSDIQSYLKKHFSNPSIDFFNSEFKKLHEGWDVWSYHWELTLFLNNAYSIIPSYVRREAGS